ncbi:MAG: tRNA adenosine(34) deaminase TadA [Deltaproteobacteria bacterium]|nr:tRNA adenosine(34) deaminase TadA [Deltaproteobacteria bacterium]
MQKETQAMHEFWMGEALEEASFGAIQGEVPVGAVAVAENEIIAKAHNIREANQDPLGHAELLLIKQLSREHGSWRLNDVTIYVTCEPCIMCMGALMQSRVPRLVFGCFEPKFGACGSLYDFSRDERLNHRIEVVPGILHDTCSSQMREFFKTIRLQERTLKI